MNSKDFAIGILSVTAAILFTTLILMHSLAPREAVAGMGGTVGQYVVTTGQVDETTGLISILDTATNRVNFYAFNPRLGQLELLQPPIEVRVLAAPRRAR